MKQNELTIFLIFIFKLECFYLGGDGVHTKQSQFYPSALLKVYWLYLPG